MMVLTPAYGRKYETFTEALADWDAGKDFRSDSGPYVNKADADLYLPSEDLFMFYRPQKQMVPITR